MKKGKVILTKDRDSSYYSKVAKARWDRVRSNRVDKLTERFEKTLVKEKQMYESNLVHLVGIKSLAKIVVQEYKKK